MPVKLPAPLSQPPLLTMTDICKSFPGVRALDGASLTVYPGEVHALMGENGAGKSTLLKILAGAQTADAGEIRLQGVFVTIGTPQAAMRLGISIRQNRTRVSSAPGVASRNNRQEARLSTPSSQFRFRPHGRHHVKMYAGHLISRQFAAFGLREARLRQTDEALRPMPTLSGRLRRRQKTRVSQG